MSNPFVELWRVLRFDVHYDLACWMFGIGIDVGVPYSLALFVGPFVLSASLVARPWARVDP